jgi:hypothetical protein
MTISRRTWCQNGQTRSAVAVSRNARARGTLRHGANQLILLVILELSQAVCAALFHHKKQDSHTGRPFIMHNDQSAGAPDPRN